jgi:hypothetical protein
VNGCMSPDFYQYLQLVRIIYFWASDKSLMKKLRKALIIFFLIITAILTLVYFFISPIAKYEIEKNAVEWTGRKITLSSLHINVLNGSIYIKNLKIYEADTNKSFFDCHSIYIKVSLQKMLSKVYAVEEIKIDEPEISIIQNGNKFNFDDILKHFLPGPNKQPEDTNASKTQYYVTNVTINNGNVTYNNVPVHNLVNIHNINFSLPAISWNDPESKLHLDFKYGTGGSFNINLDANRKTFDYNLSLLIDKYDLSQYYAPLNAFLKISSFNGMLSTKLRMKGKFNSPKDFALAGYLHINNVVLKDSARRKFFALGELSIAVDTINAKHDEYLFRSIIVDKPYMELESYENGSNFSHMVKYRETPEKELKDTVTAKKKVDYSNIFTLLASSVKAMALDFFNANYGADTIAIRNGDFVFNDITPDNKFHYTVTHINLETGENGARNKRIQFNASAKLNDTGKFIMSANVGFKQKDRLLDYKITTLKISHISPVVKYVIEKNDMKWIGRQVTIGHIKIDALNGVVRINDLKVYEANSDQVFFGCHKVTLKANMDKMLSGIYAMDTIRFDDPQISVLQDGNKFNFDDLKKRFSSDTAKPTTPDTFKIPYSIKNIIINNGKVIYNNIPIHNIFSLHNINLNVPEVSWNNPESKAHLDFEYGKGGDFSTDMDINRNTLDYTVDLDIINYDLSQYYTPLTTYLNVSSLKGFLTSYLEVHGKLNNPKDIGLDGYLKVDDFELRDSTNEKVFAFGELLMNIDTINVKSNLYNIYNISMDKPYMRFDYYPNGNNISQMIKYTSAPAPVTDNNTGEIKPDYSNIFTLLSSSIKLMAVDFFKTNYHTDSITIHNGQFAFNDYTLNNPFHYNISKINLITNEISAKSKDIQLNASSTLNDTGKFVMNADISLDLKNMLLNYTVTSLRIADFNPYSEYYIATPFWSGYMNYQSTDSVINRILKSTNIIHIEDLEAGKKTDDKPVYNLPVRMAVSLLKDDKGNIDLNLPASGNLDDPNYKVGKLVWPMISDLLKKTAESPFKLLGKALDKNPADLKQFNFDYLQDKVEEKEIHKLDDVYKVLKKKKDLDVEIIQVIDSMEEKDELALSMAKEQYYRETKQVVNDSLLSRRKKKKEAIATDEIATQDTLFNKYLDDKLKLTGNKLITIEDKCIQLIGDALLTNEVHKLMEGRNLQVTEFLIKKKSVSPKRVSVFTNKDSLLLRDFPEPVYYIKYKAGE